MTEGTTTLDDALSGEVTQQQPEPEATPAPEQAEPTPEPKGGDNDDGGVTVPLKALHEVRDANRALKLEMDALKQAQQPAPEPEQVPDPIEDPQAYHEYVQRTVRGSVQQVEANFQSRLLNMSEAQAVRTHGADAVEAAKEWALSQPDSVKAEIVGQSDPYEHAVQEHKRQTVTQQITSDPATLDAFQKFLAGQKNPEPPKAPPSNTAVDQSVGARQVQWGGPTSLDDIFSN